MCQRRKRLAMKSSLLLSYDRYINKFRRMKKSVAHEITLTLLCQSMWLLFTYFPTHLYYFLISFKLINDHDRDNSTFNFLIRLNLFIYLAFSPTLYVILSSTLRGEIHSYIRRSYKRHRPRSLSNMSSAQSKLRHLFCDSHEQQRNTQQIVLTILVTTSEQIPRKFSSKTISVPRKSHYLSKSAPCLIMYNNDHENQSKQSQKFERSNTLLR